MGFVFFIDKQLQLQVKISLNEMFTAEVMY